jgi:hypothetical protein
MKIIFLGERTTEICVQIKTHLLECLCIHTFFYCALRLSKR